MKKFIQTDSGRTLLEMILVISLIGLLSMVGLYGYQVAVAKSEAQGINKQVATIVQERRHLLMGSEKNTPMPQKIPGPYGIDFHVENGTNGPEEDYFLVSFTIKEKKLCKEVVKSPFISPSQITINGALNSECEENASIALWFGKDGGRGNGLNTYTENGKTYICPMNATCSDGTFKCKTGYYRVNLGCTPCPNNAAACIHEGFTCPEGYRKTETNCLERVGCNYPKTTCDEDGNPTACADGYYLKNNECKDCPSNSTKCDSDGKATECETGYCLHNGVCDELPDNATCTATGFNCNPNYYKDGNECKQCPENTQTCSGTTFRCLAGYYKDENTCKQCGDREISAAGATECTTCTTPGKTNNATHTDCTENCQKGDPNCGCSGDTPYADGNGGCTANPCTSEKHLVDGLCCDYGYKANTQKTSCIQCSESDQNQEQNCKENCQECLSVNQCGYCTQCGAQHERVEGMIYNECCTLVYGSYCPLYESVPEVCTPTCAGTCFDTPTSLKVCCPIGSSYVSDGTNPIYDSNENIGTYDGQNTPVFRCVCNKDTPTWDARQGRCVEYIGCYKYEPLKSYYLLLKQGLDNAQCDSNHYCNYTAVGYIRYKTQYHSSYNLVPDPDYYISAAECTPISDKVVIKVVNGQEVFRSNETFSSYLSAANWCLKHNAFLVDIPDVDYFLCDHFIYNYTGQVYPERYYGPCTSSGWDGGSRSYWIGGEYNEDHMANRLFPHGQLRAYGGVEYDSDTKDPHLYTSAYALCVPKKPL